MSSIDPDICVLIAGVNVSDDSVKEKWTRHGGSAATRSVRCDWNDRLTVVRAILGGGATIVPGAGGIDTVVVPAAYPDGGGLVANDIEVTGEGTMSVGPNGMAAYERAILTIEYKVPDYQVGSPLEIGDDELETSSTAIALDQNTPAFQFVGGPKIPPSALPVLNFTTVTFNRARHNIKTLPEALIESLADSCNSQPIFGAAAEMIVFRGARSQRKVTTAGEANWSITYTFEKHPVGWNKLWKSPGGWTDFRKLDGTGTIIAGDAGKLFPPADLSLLFA